MSKIPLFPNLSAILASLLGVKKIILHKNESYIFSGIGIILITSNGTHNGAPSLLSSRGYGDLNYLVEPSSKDASFTVNGKTVTSTDTSTINCFWLTW